MLDTLAHQPDPYPTYAALREQGVHRHADGRWVVARAVDVEELLGSAAAAVGFVATDDPGSEVQGRMARFSDGADHDRRRALAVARLAKLTPERLRSSARDLTRRRLDRAGTVEIMGTVARHAPIAALAVELGTDPEAAVAATRELALALAPPAGSSRGDVAGTAARLVRLIEGPEADPLDEATINVVALLFQAIDATAGLVGNTLIDHSRFGPAPTDDLVAETTRFDPAVQLTTRVSTGPVEVGGVAIPTGERIVVLLAAANRDPDRFPRPDQFDPHRTGPSPYTFGVGPRPCPGTAHALALASGVIDAVLDTGATLVESPTTYEPRPNLRIPSALTIRLPG